MTSNATPQDPTTPATRGFDPKVRRIANTALRDARELLMENSHWREHFEALRNDVPALLAREAEALLHAAAASPKFEGEPGDVRRNRAIDAKLQLLHRHAIKISAGFLYAWSCLDEEGKILLVAEATLRSMWAACPREPFPVPQSGGTPGTLQVGA